AQGGFRLMGRHFFTLVALAVVCIIVIMPGRVLGQSYEEVFGQNRLQFRKFKWEYFDTKHYRVYFYDKTGRTLGRYVAEQAEVEISVVEKKLGGQFPKRFNIILYNTYDE